jgi:phosphatidylserine/phosphatidylglycerophosphate/cardiolipin synthase-like enzyme
MMATPPDRIAITSDERRAAVIDIIAAARSRLLLSLFRCDDADVLDALVDAVGRGVSVEVLMTHRARGGRKRLDLLATVLANAGAVLHRYGDAVVKYHAKYIAADERLALVGSANWTRKCLDETCDFVLTTADTGVVRALARLFASDCAGRLDRDATHDRLLIGPEQARDRVASLLRSASSSIEIVDPKLTDPEMRGVLDERREAGVHVTCLGRRDVGGRTAHGKLILIDRRLAAIGSLSLSAVHLGFRRELAITTTEPAAVAAASGFFAALESARGSRDGVGAQPLSRGSAL